MTQRPFIPADDEARTRVVHDHASLLTVEAGAGTGKTTLLTDRYVDLVKKGLARPTEIVAITFTEKAASELKDRIRSELSKIGLTEAVNELDRSPISTIHSFAGSLLRERPLEAQVDPNFTVMDDLSLDLFLSSAYERWLPEALAAHRDAVVRALASGIRLDRIRDGAFWLYRDRDLIDALPQSAARPDISAAFDRIATEALSLWNLAKEACRNPLDEGYLAIEALAREVELAQNAPEAFKERAILLRFSAPAKGNQNNWMSADACRQQKTRMGELGKKIGEIKASIRQSVFTDLLHVLATFTQSAERAKQEAGLLDFDDLLFVSRRMLRDHPDVREYFGRRYKYFLVDEFQDTDPVQVEIIWFLCSSGPNQNWKERDLSPGKLFLVGDPKQSIYRFRRADIDTYRAATDRIARQGEHIVIHQNFRSSPPLVAWFNEVFEPILHPHHQPLAPDARHAVRENQKPVWFLKAEKLSGSENARQTRLLEAETIAALLCKILEDKEPCVWDAKSGELRPARLGDIALLFPTTTDIDLFEEQLRRYNLPFSLEGGRMFYGRAEIHALVSSLDAVAHPADAVAVVAALRSSLFGLSDQDLLELKEIAPSLDFIKTDPGRLQEPSSSAFRILKLIHDLKSDLPVSRLILELLHQTAAYPLALGRFHGEQAAANRDCVGLIDDPDCAIFLCQLSNCM